MSGQPSLQFYTQMDRYFNWSNSQPYPNPAFFTPYAMVSPFEQLQQDFINYRLQLETNDIYEFSGVNVDPGPPSEMCRQIQVQQEDRFETAEAFEDSGINSVLSSSSSWNSIVPRTESVYEMDAQMMREQDLVSTVSGLSSDVESTYEFDRYYYDDLFPGVMPVDSLEILRQRSQWAEYSFQDQTGFAPDSGGHVQQEKSFCWSETLDSCGLFNCPFEQSQTSLKSEEEREECVICAENVPARALLFCPKCSNGACAACLVRTFMTSYGALKCCFCRAEYNSLASRQLLLFYEGHKGKIPIGHPEETETDFFRQMDSGYEYRGMMTEGSWNYWGPFF